MEVELQPFEIFEISFTEPIAAFGAYFTDLGDFGGTLIVTSISNVQTEIVIPATVNGPNGAA
eukprot:8850223-Prorocentrum_lima.AAC.1